ncbi:MAG: hypothetical protein OXI12_06630, partial [Gammaproteobacteria bacterium]|nr:hypothetical protein [Gammaproteobacteria bacterium]
MARKQPRFPPLTVYERAGVDAVEILLADIARVGFEAAAEQAQPRLVRILQATMRRSARVVWREVASDAALRPPELVAKSTDAERLQRRIDSNESAIAHLQQQIEEGDKWTAYDLQPKLDARLSEQQQLRARLAELAPVVSPVDAPVMRGGALVSDGSWHIRRQPVTAGGKRRTVFHGTDTPNWQPHVGTHLTDSQSAASGYASLGGGEGWVHRVDVSESRLQGAVEILPESLLDTDVADNLEPFYEAFPETRGAATVTYRDAVPGLSTGRDMTTFKVLDDADEWAVTESYRRGWLVATDDGAIAFYETEARAQAALGQLEALDDEQFWDAYVIDTDEWAEFSGEIHPSVVESDVHFARPPPAARGVPIPDLDFGDEGNFRVIAETHRTAVAQTSQMITNMTTEHQGALREIIARGFAVDPGTGLPDTTAQLARRI